MRNWCTVQSWCKNDKWTLYIFSHESWYNDTKFIYHRVEIDTQLIQSWCKNDATTFYQFDIQLCINSVSTFHKSWYKYDEELKQSWYKVDTQLCEKPCINFATILYQPICERTLYQLLWEIDTQSIRSWYTTLYELRIHFASTLFQLCCVSNLIRIWYRVDTKLIHNYVSTSYQLSCVSTFLKSWFIVDADWQQNWCKVDTQLCINSVSTL